MGVILGRGIPSIGDSSVSGMGLWTRCWRGLGDEAHQLVCGEREHAEHAMAHHLRSAADADMAATKLVLEAAIDAFNRGAFLVADGFRQLESDALEALIFCEQFLLQVLVAAGVAFEVLTRWLTRRYFPWHRPR